MRSDLFEKGSTRERLDLIAEMKYALITSRGADGSLYSCLTDHTGWAVRRPRVVSGLA
jgi:hypothetical protein